mmetsp:Transcript_10713/g.24863  ORF Transcript_10713/g.24863 Transcript_10713/m.24863 type:complete len:743 (-) Transcript_10713:102-2330(-)
MCKRPGDPPACAPPKRACVNPLCRSADHALPAAAEPAPPTSWAGSSAGESSSCGCCDPAGRRTEGAGTAAPSLVGGMFDENPWMISPSLTPALIPSRLLPSGLTSMSPALMPTSAISVGVERLPLLESQSSSDQHFFPLEAAAAPSPAEGVSETAALAEGGIMMLSDLQEKHTSRATLSSAWRDYGAQLLVASKPERPLSAIASCRRGAGETHDVDRLSGVASGRSYLEGPGSSLDSCRASQPACISRLLGVGDSGPGLSALTTSLDVESGDEIERLAQIERLAELSQVDSDFHDDAMRPKPPANGAPAATAAKQALSEQLEALPAGAAGALLSPRIGAAVDGFAASGSLSPSTAPTHMPLSGDGDAREEPEEEAVIEAVVAEMASSALSQHTVALQAGISQPVLCTWLVGRGHKACGKHARHVIKAKLISWLSSRSVELADCLPSFDAVLAPAVAPPHPPAGKDTIPPLLLGADGLNVTAPRPRSSGGRSGVRGGTDAKGGGEAKAGSRAPAKSRARSPFDEPDGARASSSARARGRSDASSADEAAESERAAAPSGSSAGSSGRIRLTPQHLYVAYIWYLNRREHDGFAAGEEEHFCFKCKDGGDVMLCDFNDGECYKSYHARCCNLKAVPEGLWECPRHRCIKCGAGQSKTDAQGRPRRPRAPGEPTTLWPCRTCPETYCGKCLPESVLYVGSEIVCGSCQQLLNSDLSALQRDLIRWDPDQFASAAGHPDWQLPGSSG